MTPHYADDWLTVYAEDALTVLRDLDASSVHCVVTSPPYWGLRDYGQDGQLGLEATPEEYVSNLVAVFREVRRVLRNDGTLWLNLGDSYAGSGKGPSNSLSESVWDTQPDRNGAQARAGAPTGWISVPGGLKPKDLVGIPWRVAFALQADGWYLRSDIIWAKPNPMPESVTDRPTKAHEYLFLLTKSARYYFDQEAVSEPAIRAGELPGGGYSAEVGYPGNGHNHDGFAVNAVTPVRARRNLRSVWNIATRPYPGAHFAVFPPELPERCIKAGSSERGVCPECGAPWERVVETERLDSRPGNSVKAAQLYGGNAATSGRGGDWATTTTGWQPTCAHPLKPVPATILDPFAGSGTVGLVANRLSRRAILIDLNPAYISQQMKRNAQVPVGL